LVRQKSLFIFTPRADNIIRKKDGDEFMDCLQNREFDLIEKMVNSILNAIAKNKKKVDIKQSLTFSILSITVSPMNIVAVCTTNKKTRYGISNRTTTRLLTLGK
jgi:hypothetical protein